VCRNQSKSFLKNQMIAAGVHGMLDSVSERLGKLRSECYSEVFQIRQVVFQGSPAACSLTKFATDSKELVNGGAVIVHPTMFVVIKKPANSESTEGSHARTTAPATMSAPEFAFKARLRFSKVVQRDSWVRRGGRCARAGYR